MKLTMLGGRHAKATTAAVMTLALLAGCGSSETNGTTGAKGANAAKGSVKVLYAGSLVNLMEHSFGPAFTRSSGYGFEGFAGGSAELAQQIKSGVRQADVFISASPTADKLLEGTAGGDHVRWYSIFASAPLELGYSALSPYAARFRSRHWYEVLSTPGIRVGRTDPKLDPKGKLTVEVIEEAAKALNRPQLVNALGHFETFPEASLVGRLQAGQLDAGFFYANEASEAHIATVPLTPVKKGATFTATILSTAPDQAAAQAFIGFLMGSEGRALLRAHGLDLPAAPTLSGPQAAVPVAVRSAVGGH